MKFDPGIHIAIHSVLSLKPGVTDLHGNPLRGKTTGSNEQAIHYEDEEYKRWENKVGEDFKSPPISLSNG